MRQTELEKKFEWLGWHLDDEQMKKVLHDIASFVVETHTNSTTYEQTYTYWAIGLIENENRKNPDTNS